MNFSDRLREERVRLGMNQTEFGVFGGVTKKTQMLYESGERAPNTDYLAAIVAAGADAMYILTGVHSCPSDSLPLTREEECLVDNYRHTSESGKAALQAVFAAFAQSEQVKKSGRKAG